MASVELAGCRFICQALTPEGRDPQAERKMDGTWCALGTSITWYDVNVDKDGRKRHATLGVAAPIDVGLGVPAKPDHPEQWGILRADC